MIARSMLKPSLALLLAAATVPVALPALGDDGPPLECVHVSGVRLSPEAPPTTSIEIRGERIHAVTTGAEARASGGCAHIDGAGRVATAGLVDAYSAVGLIELGSERGTHDVDNRHPAQPADATVRAAVETAWAWNPRSVVLPVTRLEGVTTVIGAPEGGILAGQGFAADLLVGPRGDSLIAPRVAQFAAFSPRHESRAGALLVLHRALVEARRWPDLKEEFEENDVAGLLTPWLDLEALQPVVRGELPLVVTTHRAADIEALLDWRAELKATHGIPLRLVLQGATEAWILRERLAREKIAVIMDPLVYGPGGFDQRHARPDAAALLDEAGVPVVFAQRDPFMTRKLRQLAGNAVREGMPWAAALRAITSHAADIYGLGHHGRLEAGAVANVVLWNGDPFETRTAATWVMVKGRVVPLRSRQTELFERYRTLPLDRARPTAER